MSRKSRARSKPFSLLNHEFSCRGKGDILLFTEMDFLYGAFYFFFNVNTLCKKNKSQIIQKRREKEEKRPLTADRHRRQTDTESHSGDPLRMRATRMPGFRFTKTSHVTRLTDAAFFSHHRVLRTCFYARHVTLQHHL